jgi:hypothetical protein
MSRVRFEPMISMLEPAKTFLTLDPEYLHTVQLILVIFNGSSSPLRALASYSLP